MDYSKFCFQTRVDVEKYTDKTFAILNTCLEESVRSNMTATPQSLVEMRLRRLIPTIDRAAAKSMGHVDGFHFQPHRSWQSQGGTPPGWSPNQSLGPDARPEQMHAFN